MELHWELGVDRGEEGTSTIEYFFHLSDAIKALKLCDDATAFIDLWHLDQSLGQALTKKDV